MQSRAAQSTRQHMQLSGVAEFQGLLVSIRNLLNENAIPSAAKSNVGPALSDPPPQLCDFGLPAWHLIPLINP